MEHRVLGKSDLRVSAIGLGLMSMSGTYGRSDDEQSIRVIHAALDRGVNFLDSSDLYGWGLAAAPGGARCLSLANYVMETGATRGATAAGGC